MGYTFKPAGARGASQGAGYYLCKTTQRPSSIGQLYKEEESLKEIANAFGVLDITDPKPIALSEFEQAIARLDLHAPEGTRPGWIKRAFDLFDVDGNGKIDFEELCFALGTTVMGAQAAGTFTSAKNCLHKVLFSPQEIPVTPEPNADSGKFKEKEGWGEGRCGQCAAFSCLCLCPCWVYCPEVRSSVGEYSTAKVGWKWQRPEKIHGMAAAVGYVNECKNAAVVEYHWQVYYIRQYTESSGDTAYTAYERMILGDTTGRLAVEDRSPVFVPNTQHKSVILSSELAVEFGSSFADRYRREKQAFFLLHAQKYKNSAKYLEEFKLPSMKDRQQIDWVEGGEKCCTGPYSRNRSVLTCTAACWWLRMMHLFGRQKYMFQKQATGFASDPARFEGDTE